MGRFTTTDPRATDYAFQSPYAYAVDNPVGLRDILGMGVEDIIIMGVDGSSFNWTPGAEYNGTDKFIAQAVEALNTLTSNPNTAHFVFIGKRATGVRFEGNAILDYAKGGKLDSKNIFIKHAKFNPQHPGSNQHIKGTVYWDPSRGIKNEGFNGRKETGAFPSMGVLLHEMGHAALFHKFGGEDWQDRAHIFKDEERMVIEKLEAPAMQSLGFGYRSGPFNHNVYDSRSDMLKQFPTLAKGRPLDANYYVPSLTPTKLKER